MLTGRQVVEEDAHDFAKAQGHDREVIAAQLQGRRAQQDAEDRRDRRTDRQHDPERQVQPEMGTCQQRVRVRADRVERDVAQIEQPGKPDDDVQAEREQDVENREVRDAHPRGADLDERERQ